MLEFLAIFLVVSMVCMMFKQQKHSNRIIQAEQKARALILAMNCKALETDEAEEMLTKVYNDTNLNMHIIYVGDLQEYLRLHRGHNTKVHTPEGFGRCVRMIECQDCNALFVGSELVSMEGDFKV